MSTDQSSKPPPPSFNPAIPQAERRAEGKALRAQVPLESHGHWAPPADRPDPIDLLQAQDTGRLEHLLPIKYGRMLASPFAFLRGSAAVMACDLAGTPRTGTRAVLCGDAHISNFGVFASPERKLVFDVNDFDEAYPGPWEWDLKRLAASAVVAGRELGLGRSASRKAGVVAAKSYADAMGQLATMRTLDVWYYHVEAEAVLKVFQRFVSKLARKLSLTVIAKARSRTQEQSLAQLTELRGGRRRFVSNPPLLVPLDEVDNTQLYNAIELERLAQFSVEETWNTYMASLPEARQYLLRRFRITDGALRVGGVGSVGTRCMIVLLEGGAANDALILQLKEAGPSVLEAYWPEKQPYAHHGQRVVMAQHLMQATSDIFLGWNTGQITGRDYYWRQLKDMKGSFDVATMDESWLRAYAGVCGWCLARAHARLADPSRISGYLGGGKTFAQAIGDFAAAYADQTERDHRALVEAVKSGRIAARTGV